MKTRSGFVSNSSTSSFCIYGAFLTQKMSESEVREKCAAFIGKDCPEDFYEALEDVATKLDLRVAHVSESDCYYVGKNWPSIKDDQTAKQFKDEIQAAVNKVFGDVKCETHQEAYYS